MHDFQSKHCSEKAQEHFAGIWAASGCASSQCAGRLPCAADGGIMAVGTRVFLIGLIVLLLFSAVHGANGPEAQSGGGDGAEEDCPATNVAAAKGGRGEDQPTDAARAMGAEGGEVLPADPHRAKRMGDEQQNERSMHDTMMSASQRERETQRAAARARENAARASRQATKVEAVKTPTFANCAAVFLASGLAAPGSMVVR